MGLSPSRLDSEGVGGQTVEDLWVLFDRRAHHTASGTGLPSSIQIGLGGHATPHDNGDVDSLSDG